ncbi:MAG: VOC family protein [Microgenomates group bacterium]
MPETNIYLNFTNETEAAFLFYKSVFGTEFEGGMSRMSEVPLQEGQPELSKSDKNLVMHVSLPILGGLKLMGSDSPESMGIKIQKGNNVHISLHPDSRRETDRLFKALSDGGEVTMPLKEMFWGDYYGICVDKFGICWMFNCSNKE